MAWKEDEGAILLDPSILSEGYHPKSISGRETQVSRLRSCLSPVLRNEKPIHAWLYGRPGTGKTATARFLSQEIYDKSRVASVHVNCRMYNSFFSILDFILNELRAGFGNERDARVKLEKLGRYARDRPLLIILDEIDFLPWKERSNLLYNLSFGKIGLVCISEGREALLSLNGRTRSRLQPQLIEFPDYSQEETAAILRERASMSLSPDSWSEQTLKEIAQLAEGDARAAIQTLRGTAELAHTQTAEKIDPDHIKEAFGGIRGFMKSYTLKRLGEHSKMLYDFIEGSEGMLSSRLWELYREECGNKGLEPIAKRTYSHYLNTMARLKLIKAERARVRGRVYLFSVRE